MLFALVQCPRKERRRVPFSLSLSVPRARSPCSPPSGSSPSYRTLSSCADSCSSQRSGPPSRSLVFRSPPVTRPAPGPGRCRATTAADRKRTCRKRVWPEPRQAVFCIQTHRPISSTAQLNLSPHTTRAPEAGLQVQIPKSTGHLSASSQRARRDAFDPTPVQQPPSPGSCLLCACRLSDGNRQYSTRK